MNAESWQPKGVWRVIECLERVESETREQCQKKNKQIADENKIKEKIIAEPKKTYKRTCRSGEISASRK
jgi:hypothetical protein